MSRDFNAQIPILVEAGWKIHPMVFLGVYGALAFGGTSQTYSTANLCTVSSRSCGASSERLGVEVQIHFRPDSRVDPWAGYGLGVETASASASGGGVPQVTDSFTGFELARFALGVDFRLTRLIGVGPFVGVDFGSYSHEQLQAANFSQDQNISNTALHEWLTLGMRVVFNP